MESLADKTVVGTRMHNDFIATENQTCYENTMGAENNAMGKKDGAETESFISHQEVLGQTFSNVSPSVRNPALPQNFGGETD